MTKTINLHKNWPWNVFDNYTNSLIFGNLFTVLACACKKNGLSHPVDGKITKRKCVRVQSGRSMWWKLSPLRSKMTYQFHGLASHGGLNLQIKQHNSRLFIYKCHTIKGGNFIWVFLSFCQFVSHSKYKN